MKLKELMLSEELHLKKSHELVSHAIEEKIR